MAKRNQFDVTIEVPGAYEASEAVLASGSKKRGQSGETPNDDMFLAALAAEHDLHVEKSFVLNRQRDYKKRSAGNEDTRVKISVDTPADERAVVLVEEDGVYRWVFAKPAAESTRNSKRSIAASNLHVFEIELAGYTHTVGKRRGLGDKLKSLAKKAKAHIIRIKDAAPGVALTMKRLEKKVDQCVINMNVSEGAHDPEAWEPLQSLEALTIPANRTPKVLLFIHGTFSSTVGSYGGLCEIPEGQQFLEKAFEAYDLVLGFDHYTLSETPSENAWELLKWLKTAPWSPDFPPVIDAIGYSRGGLVLRSLVEKELPDDAWAASIKRAIFVGATNAGTELAKPENWHQFIDFYTNLAAGSSRVVSFLSGAGVGGFVFTGMIRGLGAFAKYLATVSVSDAKIPGLSAMEPDGPFVTEINETQPGQPGPEDVSYYAITSDFDIDAIGDGPSPGLPKRIALSLGGRVVERLLGDTPNDLVVDTPSMTRIDPQTDGLLKEVQAFGQNGQVYHTVYFTQPATARALHGWLDLPGRLTTPADHAQRSAAPVVIADNEIVSYNVIETAVQTPAEQPHVQVAVPVRDLVRPTLKISVHWDDITEAEGDVYAVGHYRGVEPQSAELAVDHHISQVSWGLPWEERKKKLVLTSLTQQGLLQGDVGQIDLFPWGDGTQRFAAICGMGFFNGDFSEQNLQLLYRQLVWKLNTLPGLNVLCTVLIGSGVGSLDTRRALRGQLNGYADAMAAFHDGENRIREVRIVEYDKLKAQEILDSLLLINRQDDLDLTLEIEEEVQSKGTGRVSEEHALSLIIGSMLQTFKSRSSKKRRELLDAYLSNSGIKSVKKRELMPRLKDAWENLEYAAGELARNMEMTNLDPTVDEKELKQRIHTTSRSLLSEQGLSRTISVKLFAASDNKAAIPNRLSIRLENDVYRIAGLTASSAVPEREIKVDVKLVHELIERMTDPDKEKALRHGKVLHQLLIPGEFEELLTSSASLVFEVDRNTAPIHWEMLVFPGREQAGAVALTLPVSRQLRTTYSNIPTARSDRERRALVIGNPDGSLEFAEEEAILVSDLLANHGFDVDTFIGAPDAARDGLGKYAPANRLDVLEKLFEGKYTIVHYAGHGDYDRDDPSKTGWLFTSGLLTAGEIQRLSDAPALIFANACLSGRTSGVTQGMMAEQGADNIAARQKAIGKPFGEAGLLPSLADEVLKLGVRNYIGTAWEVDDKGAILFAERFYETFLGGASIGESIHEARKKLSRHAQYRALWAAYQHYGPPDFILP
ncbi:MAG: CHAT domain-containing protein [Bacteroidota bacterium]